MTEDPFELQEKSDYELYVWIAGWNPNTDRYIAGQQELKRRNERPSELRGWIAIGISACALVVSIIALTLSLSK